jgi:hypothetical protein
MHNPFPKDALPLGVDQLPDDRPVIEIKDGELSDIASLAEDALFYADLPIYQRSGKLVRPITETVDASHGRTTMVAQLHMMDAVYTRDTLCRYINFQKYDGRKKALRKVNPPKEIAVTILARAGEWMFSPIAGVITTPTMRPDGSLLNRICYDEATRLLLIDLPAMPPIPDKPTRDDALKAIALIEDLLVEFPFVDEVAKAVALSAIITPVVRAAFPVAPMHVARAPTSGSGKSYLWDIVAAIVIGQPMPVMAAGANAEETEKRLGAALLAGQSLISIDNVNGELGGDALCQIIERPIVDVRVLGKSERVRIEARGTSTFASGNNIIIVGDVCRRVITCTLDPQMERPELRQFKSNPVKRVLQNRGAYIAACLTFCRAYLVAGRPQLAPKLASFEGWSDAVRSALIWCGKADAVLSMEVARMEDPERAELADMLNAWADSIGIGHEHRSTLASVIETANKMTVGIEPEPEKPELFAAVQAAAFAVTLKRGLKPDAKLLGLWMQRRKGRVIDGKRFAVKSNPKGGSTWWIEQVSAGDVAGGRLGSGGSV